MNSVFQVASEPFVRSAGRTHAEIVESCYVRTAQALSVSRAANDDEIKASLAIVRDSMENGKPLDLLETLARVKGHEEERIGVAILALSDAVASTMNPAPSCIPFASKLIAPSAFYDSFDAMHELGKLLLTPVIFAEDTDAIGTGSVNPIAAQVLGEEIHHAVSKRFGIRPFVTVARMEYESWAFLCRKHFDL
ncbi:MAG: hypothetical protein RLZZ505_1676 [Verrucomicrobiota bacterium]|jgi:hypothetical protein